MIEAFKQFPPACVRHDARLLPCEHFIPHGIPRWGQYYNDCIGCGWNQSAHDLLQSFTIMRAARIQQYQCALDTIMLSERISE